MTIAVGAIGTGTVNQFAEVQSCTTVGVNTTVSGSSFGVFCLAKAPSAGAATWSGTIAGTVLTVNSVSVGTITTGMMLNGAGITQGTTITTLGTGTGGTGTYNLSLSNTVGTAETMNGYSNLAITCTDSQSNTYTQIGTNLFVPQGPAIIMARFLCTNGTGNATHTATVSVPTGFTEAWTVWLVEMVNAATTGVLDQSNTNASNFSSQPWTAGNVTIASKPGSELLVGILSTAEYPGTTISVGAPWTLQSSFASNNGNVPPSGALATYITGTAGTYSASFTSTNGGTGAKGNTIDTFIGSATAGTSTSIAWIHI